MLQEVMERLEQARWPEGLRLSLPQRASVLTYQPDPDDPWVLSADRLLEAVEIEAHLRPERRADAAAGLGLVHQVMVTRRRQQAGADEGGLRRSELHQRLLVLACKEERVVAVLMLQPTSPNALRSYRLCGTGEGGARMILLAANCLAAALAADLGQPVRLGGSSRTYGFLAAAQAALEQGESPASLLQRLPEWRHLNQDCSLQLLRRFQHREVQGVPYWNKGLANWRMERAYSGEELPAWLECFERRREPPALSGPTYSHLQDLVDRARALD